MHCMKSRGNNLRIATKTLRKPMGNPWTPAAMKMIMHPSMLGAFIISQRDLRDRDWYAMAEGEHGITSTTAYSSATMKTLRSPTAAPLLFCSFPLYRNCSSGSVRYPGFFRSGSFVSVHRSPKCPPPGRLPTCRIPFSASLRQSTPLLVILDNAQTLRALRKAIRAKESQLVPTHSRCTVSMPVDPTEAHGRSRKETEGLIYKPPLTALGSVFGPSVRLIK